MGGPDVELGFERTLLDGGAAMSLSSADAARLAAALPPLLSLDACTDADAWRTRALRTLRDLADADAACVAVEGNASRFAALGLDDQVTRAYRDHYAAVDYGIARQTAGRLEVWDRGLLWKSRELVSSEYYNDFALPYGLLDAAGLATCCGSDCTRVSLLYAHPPRRARTPAERRRRLELLRLAWPAFHTGAVLSARTDAWQTSMAHIIDGVAHPLALCTASGRILHQNPALEQLVAANPCAQLTDMIRATARAVSASPVPRRPGDTMLRDIHLRTGRWRLLGWPLDWALGAPATVLATLLPAQDRPQSCEELRQQYRALRGRVSLTSRQWQVVDLLRHRRSNAEIAETLRISEHTARHHTETVLSKLGLHSRRQVEMEYEALVEARPTATAPASSVTRLPTPDGIHACRSEPPP